MEEKMSKLSESTELINVKEKQPVNGKVNGQAVGEDMLLENSLVQTRIEDITIRPTTMDDLDQVVEMLNACSIHMAGIKEVSSAVVRMDWELPIFELDKLTRVAETSDGKIVGYVEVWDIDEMPAHIWVWARVHPDYENHGIGSRLMAWAESRAGQAIDRAPGDIRISMQSGTYSTYEPAKRFLSNLSMKQMRHFLTMAIELDSLPPVPQWPDGIQIRTMTGEEEARDVVWAFEDAFKDHWGYVEQPFEKELEIWLHFIRNDEQYDPTLWFLAMDGEEIAGVSICKLKSDEDPDMGWVRILGVRRAWRRQGLALALLHHSFGELFRRGQKRAGLGVDASSLTGATRLYEKAGMGQIRQYTVFDKELRPGRDISLTTLE